MAVTAASERPRPLGAFVAGEIRAEMARQRMSGREMARRLGESPMWVSTRVSGAVPIDMDDLERMSNVLAVPPAKMLPSLTQPYVTGRRHLAVVA